MKIAYFLPSLARTGPIIVVNTLVKHLLNKTEKIDIYYFKDKTELDFPVNCTKIDLDDVIDFNAYDILHSHMIKPDYYLWKNAFKIKKPIVSTIHQYIYPTLKYDYNTIIASFFTPLWYKFLRRHTAIAFVSNNLKTHILNQANINYPIVIHNGIDLECCPPAPADDIKIIHSLKEKYRLVGSFSHFTRRKGIDQIIKALPDLEDYALLLIGFGKEVPALLKLAKDLHVSERCRYLGFRTNAASYYRFLDLYAMPSLSEGFPLSLIEATANKVPVVCSDIPIFREFFFENEVGFFKLNDKASLINSILGISGKFSEMTKAAFEKYSLQYTSEIMAKKYLELYKSLE
jgi:L-malate glycosyltransferase